MDDLVLYIFKEQRDASCHYTFVLEEPKSPPVIGTKEVTDTDLESLDRFYIGIAEATRDYIAALKHASGDNVARACTDDFKHSVSEKIEELSDLIVNFFWPEAVPRNSAFNSRFHEIESECAKSSVHPHLLIASNDSKIPWWVKRCASPNEELLLCEVFALGMISLRTSPAKPEHSPAPVSIRVITCPTMDLAIRSGAGIPEVDLDHIKNDLKLTADYVLFSGRKPHARGLDETQIRQGFKQGKVVLYHGHFNLDPDLEAIGNSRVWARGTEKNPFNDKPDYYGDAEGGQRPA